jgi:hypothetical protein
LSVRAEFTNIFNRTEPNNPTYANALAPTVTAPNGAIPGGFGAIEPGATGVTFVPPRSGRLVARFIF